MVTANTATEQTHHQMFIGGSWVDALSGETFPNQNRLQPGATIGTVASGNRADAHRAVEAAGEAFAAWARTAPAVRQRIFLDAASILESRRDEVVGLLAAETGCTFGFGMFQMGFVPGLLRQSAASPTPARRGDPVRQRYVRDGPPPPGRGRRRHRPMERRPDPVRPLDRRRRWRSATPSSSSRPRIAGSGGLLWAEIFAEAGSAQGVLNVVTHAQGEARPSGTSCREPEGPPDQLHGFQQPPAGGSRRPQGAAEAVVLELGGSNPLIVLGDADLEYAVNASAFGAYLHQGQICMSTRRIIVERRSPRSSPRGSPEDGRIQDGRPERPDTVIGPLINEQAFERSGRVDEAIAWRAKVLAGGTSIGPCLRGNVAVATSRDSSDLARHETFGPVAAVEIVANTEKPSFGPTQRLRAIVRRDHEDPTRGLALAHQSRPASSTSTIRPVGDEPQMPFGGVKDSGWGRFGGTRLPSTSSPSSNGSRSRAGVIRFRSRTRPQDALGTPVGDETAGPDSWRSSTTIRASSATAPCPSRYTTTGLSSISRIDGSARRISATRAMILARASTSAGGVPRKPRSKAACLSRNTSLDDARHRQIRWQDPNVVQQLGLYAPEAGQEERAPLRIIAAAHDELDAALTHLLDQDAVKSDAQGR